MEQDNRAKVACETFAKTGMIMVGGEISSKANVNYQKVIRDTIKVNFSFQTSVCISGLIFGLKTGQLRDFMNYLLILLMFLKVR